MNKTSLCPSTTSTEAKMLNSIFLRRLLRRSQPVTAFTGEIRSIYSSPCEIRYFSSTAEEQKCTKSRGKWFTLPPVGNSVNGAALGEKLAGRRKESNISACDNVTALKWVLRCCPELPRSLVQKLFRLRQVCFRFCSVSVKFFCAYR